MTLMRGMTVEGPGTLTVFNNIRRTTGEAGTSNIENGDGGDGGTGLPGVSSFSPVPRPQPAMANTVRIHIMLYLITFIFNDVNGRKDTHYFLNKRQSQGKK